MAAIELVAGFGPSCKRTWPPAASARSLAHAAANELALVSDHQQLDPRARSGPATRNHLFFEVPLAPLPSRGGWPRDRARGTLPRPIGDRHHHHLAHVTAGKGIGRPTRAAWLRPGGQGEPPPQGI